MDYDYLMWIDSDIVFTPAHFQRLLSHDKDIVTGIYMMDGGKQFATVEKWDEGYFKQHGCFEFLTEQTLSGKEGLMSVCYTGMGFMLVKRGVFESLEYPWFRPVEKKIGDREDPFVENAGRA